MEQELRKQAIQRYRNHEQPKAIYTDLNRSKYWFFKWLKRYQSGDPDWYKDQQHSVKLTNNGSFLSENALSHKNLHKPALRPSNGN
jgi:hypothetical protein